MELSKRKSSPDVTEFIQPRRAVWLQISLRREVKRPSWLGPFETGLEKALGSPAEGVCAFSGLCNGCWSPAFGGFDQE